MEMQDRVVIVSGATSGIGKAIASRFVDEGARVAILGLNDEQGNEVQEQLRAAAKKHGAAECIYLHADISDITQVRKAVTAVIERWHQIHVLVNNAAIMKTGALVDMDEGDWDKTLAINLKGPFLLSKYAIPVMPPHAAIIKTGALVDMDEGDWDKTLAINLKGPFLLSKYAIPVMPPHAAIINISSVHAIATDAHSAAYSASKGGLEAFTRALALECYPRKVRVNALRLGAVDTGMLWNNPDVQSGEEHVDPAEVATPAQIAEATLFLASQRSLFVSGAVLTVDGGRLPILGSHAN
jgi:NAD(P)-dependent dehydrogenase (short-subunit alcohol dehydrogenase family)